MRKYLVLAALFLSSCANATEPPKSTPSSSPEIDIRLAKEHSCVAYNGIRLNPVENDNINGKNLGDSLELSSLINGRINERKNLVFDGRKWWDLTGIPECKK